MSNYRRVRVAGGTYFFTVVTCDRIPIFEQAAARELLGDVYRDCASKWPFQTDAVVLLPDHLHTIWTLPTSDDRYSARWGWIKKEFTSSWLQQGGRSQSPTASARSENRRGIWQRRFWEHTIEDEEDFEAHFDYIHYNPVKHGYCPSPRDWPWSSFHRWVRAGVYESEWGCDEPGSAPAIGE